MIRKGATPEWFFSQLATGRHTCFFMLSLWCGGYHQVGLWYEHGFGSGKSKRYPSGEDRPYVGECRPPPTRLPPREAREHS